MTDPQTREYDELAAQLERRVVSDLADQETDRSLHCALEFAEAWGALRAVLSFGEYETYAQQHHDAEARYAAALADARTML